eukprot:654525-Pleurochrysis_carterae.AAC.4
MPLLVVSCGETFCVGGMSFSTGARFLLGAGGSLAIAVAPTARCRPGAFVREREGGLYTSATWR